MVYCPMRSTQDWAYCTVIEGVGSMYGLNPVDGLAPLFE